MGDGVGCEMWRDGIGRPGTGCACVVGRGAMEHYEVGDMLWDEMGLHMGGDMGIYASEDEME